MRQEQRFSTFPVPCHGKAFDGSRGHGPLFRSMVKVKLDFELNDSAKARLGICASGAHTAAIDVKRVSKVYLLTRSMIESRHQR